MISVVGETSPSESSSRLCHARYQFAPQPKHCTPAASANRDFSSLHFLETVASGSHRRGVSSGGMAQALTIRTVARRRGNPNWGRPLPPVPPLATEFEQQIQRLGLAKKSCTDSPALRHWCERNCNRCYVPESLLAAWGIVVEAIFSEPPLRQKRSAKRALID